MGQSPPAFCKMVTGCEESVFEIDRVEMCGLDTTRDTQIIFDWDDTLMCSSEVKAHRNPGPEEMRQLEDAVACVLRTALKLGKTIIVTNANLCWVRATASLFMPSIVPLLQLIDVVSARQNYEGQWPGNPSAWKRETFRDIVCCDSKSCSSTSCIGQHDTKDACSPATASDLFCPVNLVVLGDSCAEIQAGKSAVESLGDPESILKTVKFKEIPSVADLLGQLHTVARDLQHIVHEEKSVNKQLVHGSLSGWSLCDENCLSVLRCL